MKKVVSKKVTEKKTGEKYASKSVMMKHEKSEGPKQRAMEKKMTMKKKMC